MAALARLCAVVFLGPTALPAIAAEPSDIEQSIIDTTAAIYMSEKRCPDLQADFGSIDILRRQFGLPGDFFNIVDGPFKSQARAALIQQASIFANEPDACTRAFSLYGHQEVSVPPLLGRR